MKLSKNHSNIHFLANPCGHSMYVLSLPLTLPTSEDYLFPGCVSEHAQDLCSLHIIYKVQLEKLELRDMHSLFLPSPYVLFWIFLASFLLIQSWSIETDKLETFSGFFSLISFKGTNEKIAANFNGSNEEIGPFEMEESSILEAILPMEGDFPCVFEHC